MKVLFIQHRYPDTFWSLRHALRFISKKAVYPPLGLMTVSAMTPVNWTKKLVDLNASFLKDEQINNYRDHGKKTGSITGCCCYGAFSKNQKFFPLL